MSLSVLIPVLVVLGIAAIAAIWVGLLAQKRPVVTGDHGVIGERGTALDDINPTGQVFLMGEYWRATASTPIPKGSHIIVIGVKRTWLIVEQDKSTNHVV